MDQRVRVDLVLQVGAIAETATVVGEVPLVETSSSDIGTIIDNKRIVELPLNGRNFIALNALDAGAATRTGAASSYFQMFGGAYSFSGSPGDSSTYTADGIAMKGQGDSRVTMKLTIDTIQEFKQQQALFSAESGGSANVNVITRSGSNQFHSGAWEFNRDSKFDAPNYFDQGEKPPFSLNQFGGTIGGQIVKDRTFYFGSYEGTRITKSVGRAFTVPSLALRGGDFRGRNIIYDPATTRPDPGRPGQFIRDPFPSNVIPADRIDPVAKRTLDMLFPLPDRPGNVQNLFAPLRNDTTEDQFTVRVDHQFSSRNKSFARYSMTDPRRYNTSFANLPNYADWWNTKAHNAVISNTYVFSQRLVNEFRFGYNRMFQYLVATDQRDIPAMLGITGTQSDIYPGPPTISISGYDSTASLSNTPNNRLEQTFVLSDKMSYFDEYLATLPSQRRGNLRRHLEDCPRCRALTPRAWDVFVHAALHDAARSGGHRRSDGGVPARLPEQRDNGAGRWLFEYPPVDGGFLCQGRLAGDAAPDVERRASIRISVAAH